MSRIQWGAAQRGGGGGGGGGRGGAGGQRGGNQAAPVDWREVVRSDRTVAERPMWLLTCYGHEREAPNDVTGDISPEEVRWANLLSAQQGASQQQLVAEFKAAEQAYVEQFRALGRAPHPPSKGGPALPPPNVTLSNLQWISGGAPTPAAPPAFGGVPAFGQPSQPAVFAPAQQPASSALFGQPLAAAAAPFGQPLSATAAPLFGQPAPFGQQPAFPPAAPPAAGGFGAAGSTGGFGGAFGSSTMGAKPAFGQQPLGFGSSPFGGSGTFGGAAAPGGFGGAAAGFGASTPFGAAPAAAAPFGQVAQPAAAAAAPPAFTAFGSQPAAPAQQLAADDPDAEAWRAPAFEKGKIPERAPPVGW